MFDADRLNLWRVGITPHPRYLSTAPAQRPDSIAWARELNRVAAPEWGAIFSSVPR